MDADYEGQEESLIVRTEHTVSIIGKWPRRHVQLIWTSCQSLSELLSFADLDCTALAYDGTTVWATRRALRALETGYNVVSPAWLHGVAPKGCVDLRSRLVKYVPRGFGTLLFQCCRHSPRCDVVLRPDTEKIMESIGQVLDTPHELKGLVFEAMAIKRRFGGNAAARHTFSWNPWLYVPLFPSIPQGPNQSLDSIRNTIQRQWQFLPLDDRQGQWQRPTRQENARAVGGTCLEVLETLDGLQVHPVSEEASKSIIDWRNCF